MATATESFIIKECLCKGMKGWGEMSWEDVYAEHLPVVQQALRGDVRINHIYDSEGYPLEITLRIEEGCANGLKKTVDAFREKYPAGAQPKNCDWPTYLLFHKKTETIEQLLLGDQLLKERLGETFAFDAANASVAVSAGYSSLINKRNAATNEYQNDQ